MTTKIDLSTVAGLKHFARTHRDSLPLQVIIPDGRRAVLATMDWIGGDVCLKLACKAEPDAEAVVAALNAEMVESEPAEAPSPRPRGRPRLVK